jgi:hypothetical protein
MNEPKSVERATDIITAARVRILDYREHITQQIMACQDQLKMWTNEREEIDTFLMNDQRPDQEPEDRLVRARLDWPMGVASNITNPHAVSG